MPKNAKSPLPVELRCSYPLNWIGVGWGGAGAGGGGSIQAHAFAQDILSWQFSDISEKIKKQFWA